MIDDDRDKRPDGADNDESVEILADAAVSAARRRPTRKLRVPNDPVPRRVDADGDDSAGRRDTVDNLDVTAPHTRESDQPPARSIEPPPRASMRPRPGSVPPPRPKSVPPPPRPASIPVPVGYDDSFDANEMTIPSMDAYDPAGSPPAAARAPSIPVPRPATTPSLPPDDSGGVVRQVRRRIKSVGTGSKPPLPRAPSAAPPPSVDASVLAAPAPDAHLEITDDFSVPPVEVESDADFTMPSGAALKAPAVPSISLGDHSDLEDHLSDSDISLEEGDHHEVEVEAEADADAEVIEEPTEEISIPEDLRDRRPPVPAAARATIPEAPKKPPAPPPTPPKTKAKEEPPPPQQTRKKRRPWWEEMFNDDYFRAMPKYTPSQIKTEGDFIEQSLGVERGAVVLDIGCGDGRQSIELAVRGYEVIALDLSLPMLSRAADAAQDREAKLNFLHSDMREMEFNEMFDAAYCTNTSFGYFDDEKNADVVQRMHRALKVGGTLLLDVVNRDYALQSQPSMTWFEADGCVCMEETSFDYIKSRLHVKRTMIMDDGRQKEAEANIRLYSLHELGLLLHQAGFRIVEVSGSMRTPGAYFGANSQQIIILAQKQKRPETTTASYPIVTAAQAAGLSIPPPPPDKKE